jgi:hypothetical protein
VLSSPRRLTAAVMLLLALQGCAGLRSHKEPIAPESPPADATAEAAPQEPVTAENTTVETPADTRPAGASAAPPACTCAEAKTKPKPRPRRRPVPKEAPPQLPTAPVVVDTPQGGTVDAQVKTMPVSVMSILGKRVKGAKGEDLGRVVDVLADASGRVRIAIIDFGGFLGVGNHRIAVEWPLLRFNPDGADPSLLLSLSPEKLRMAPEYKDNPRPQTLMEPTAAAPAAPTAPTAAAAAVAPAQPAAVPAAEVKK